jgi:hypothetical protein
VTSSIVNDIHSELNETIVEEIASVDSLESIGHAILRARSRQKAVAIAGGRHAMGGQQFCGGGMLLDTRGLDRILGFDTERGTTQFAEFLRLKRKSDPEERFQSDWYRHYRVMFEGAEPLAEWRAPAKG